MAEDPKKPPVAPGRAITDFLPSPLDSKQHGDAALFAPTFDNSSPVPLAPIEAQREVQVGDVLAGKYRLTGALGGGGMGTVFRGEHLSLGIPIAVKVMKPLLTSDSEFVGRFQREARAASSLSHPGVVRMLDFSLTPVPYLVMEFIEGQSLGESLGQLTTPPPLGRVAEILLQVLSALEAAHAEGIVHRDLKPDNIVLSRDPSGKKTVKIVDFGLARLDSARDLTPRLTRADYVAGTPAYMSPEQCRSLAVGPSSDLYAVGCILTELLQLQPPFAGGSSMDVMSAQMFMPPPSLARASDAEPVPELLERLRLDLLAKLPDQRPASASVVSQRLLEAMDPVLSEALLPKRKGDLPLGSRDERAVSGYRSPSQRPGGGAPLSVPVTVQLLSLGGAAGLDEACVTALGIQGIQVARRASSSSLDLQASALVILDVGSDLSSAQAEMAHVRAKLPDAQLVVCADGLDTTTMNLLIEAGAADIARYPIDINTFVRKLKRLVRRFAG